MTYYDREMCVAKVDRGERDRNRDVEQEFGEQMRDPRFPSGWYILPSFGIAILIAATVIFL